MEDTSCAQFQPNQEMLESLLNIGISKEAGEQVSYVYIKLTKIITLYALHNCLK